LALKSDGTIVSWGSETNLPAGLTNVVAIAAGVGRSLAIIAELRIESLRLNGPYPAILFHTFSDQQYAVEYSSNLGPGSWSNLPGGGVIGTGQEMLVSDTNAFPNAGNRFYRLRQLQ
jgi:hypothetical protein